MAISRLATSNPASNTDILLYTGNRTILSSVIATNKSSDAATIIKESDIHHPAAKMIAMAAKMQENECGDGTNLVISFAGDLMNHA